MKSPIQWKQYYHSPACVLPGEDVPLGCRCRASGTDFSLWSPLAEEVFLLLYRDGTDGDADTRIPMDRGPADVWTASLPGNLHGTYYLYEIHREGEAVLCPDPYARACGCNSLRSMAVDLRQTDPAGWESDLPPVPGPETVIWETHVKEFSWDPAGGFPEEMRGKFRAFTCPDTSLHGDGLHPTGVSYLKHLGVTHIQLMPIFDYGSVDERNPDAFNWGYDPVNYNVPEGSYCSDPTRGEIRIRECKEMIQALHRAGLRVIMDVVFNHTYSLDSCLNRAAPWYYYRLRKTGAPSNGSGCGSEIASEAPMCSRYILDSVLYWAREYHIDGFRFDLMGLLDVPLLNRIQAELDRIWGAGEKLLYGEPWTGGKSAIYGIPANKSNIKLLNPAIGVFSDHTRDSIKGHVFDRTLPGYLNGAAGQEPNILHSVCGWCDSTHLLRAPSQHIAYVSAHDNLTLWDKLCATVREEENLLPINRMAAAILLSCQGRPFFLSGEEFARTKNGKDNTYRDSISLNRLDWTLAWKNADLVNYYRGLIALRKQCPGLCDKGPTAPGRMNHAWYKKNVIQFELDNRSEHGDSPWKTLCLILNARPAPVVRPLRKGEWKVLADGMDSFLWKNPLPISGSASVPAHSVLILGK